MYVCVFMYMCMCMPTYTSIPMDEYTYEYIPPPTHTHRAVDLNPGQVCPSPGDTFGCHDMTSVVVVGVLLEPNMFYFPIRRLFRMLLNILQS